MDCEKSRKEQRKAGDTKEGQTSANQVVKTKRKM